MTAMAATVTVTYNPDDSGVKNGSYTAYQVFTGIPVTNNSAQLTNIAWNSDFEGIMTDKKTELLEWLNNVRPNLDPAVPDAYTEVTLDNILKCLGAVSNDSQLAREFARIISDYMTGKTITGTELTADSTELPGGYYLIVHTADEGKTKNLSLLQVVGDQTITIKEKIKTPAVEKKIWEDAYIEDGDFTGSAAFDKEYTNVAEVMESGQWNDVADYDIGDSVPFKLTATIPANTVSEYKGDVPYGIKFVDTLQDGLKNNKDYKVYYKIGDGNISAAPLTKDEDYTVEPDTVTGFTLSVANVKSLYTPGQNGQIDYTQAISIYVTFTAELTENAEVDAPNTYGEENSVVLKYSNDYTTGDIGGETTPDTVVALTFDMDIQKYTGDIQSGQPIPENQLLADARFKLYKIIDAEEWENVSDPLKTDRNTVNNVTTQDLLAKDNAALQEMKFTAVTSATQTENVYNVAATGGEAEFVTVAEKTLILHGLDRGDYILVETQAPTGYNLLNEATKVTIKRTNTDGYVRDGYTTGTHAKAGATSPTKQVTFNFTVGTDEDQTAVQIKNNSGSTLPETGGTGTMLLYIAGTALMAGGVFFLVSRRRKEEEN